MSGIDQLVSTAESEVQTVQVRAEQIVNEIKKSMPSHLKEMADKIVYDTIEENPKVVTDLGNKVKDLKKQIANLERTFPDEVSKKLDNIEWAHKRDIGAEKEKYLIKDTLKKETEMALNNAGCLVLGKLGSLLIENNLAKQSENSYWETKNHGISFRYGMGFYSSIEKTKFIKDKDRYISIINEYVEMLIKLEAARNNKKKTEARKFWDEA